MSKSLGPSVDKATAYCTYCPKLCRFSCPVAEAENRETVTPWGLNRLLELVKDGAVEPDESVAETFYHCTACRRCQTWCKHDNDLAESMFAARAWMRELGHVPELMEGFVEFFYEGKSPHTEADDLHESTHGAFDPKGSVVFMPDCETRKHYPDLIERVGKLLEDLLGEKARLATRDSREGSACCGFPALAAGDDAGYRRYRNELFAELGECDYVLTDCAAFATLHREGGSFGWESLDEPEVVHIIEFLAEFSDALPVEEPLDATTMKLHDSCFVGRHLELYDETREVLTAISDGRFDEFQFNRDDAPCCGGAAHYHVIAPEASKRCASSRLEQLDREGGKSVVCGSATCKKAFRRVRDDSVATDLLELVCRACGL